MSAQSLIDVVSAAGAQWHSYRDELSIPYAFGDVQAEYSALSQRAGLHYSGHWGRLVFTGSDHVDFLHRMTTNHFLDLGDRFGLQAVFTEQRGRIVDWATFYHRDLQTLAIVSPAAHMKVRDWLDRFLFTEEVTISDLTADTSAFELLGPDAYSIAEESLDLSLDGVQPHQTISYPLAPDLWITALQSPWRGLRLVGRNEALVKCWNLLTEAGASPAGERAWNIQRIELGHPLSGNELNEEHNPWEAGLYQSIHMNKGCYIGQEVIARLDTYDKIKQHLVGIACETDSLPEAGTVLLAEEKAVGAVTSSAYSPSFGPIALAYVRRGFSVPDTVLTRADNSHQCRVQSLPFQAAC